MPARAYDQVERTARDHADALHLDLDKPTDKAKVRAALKMYIAAKTLVVVERMDEQQRKLRNFIEVP
jgi:hypothetical protein